MPAFKIEAKNLSWINNQADDPHDLCLHGDLTLKAGEKEINGHGTLSASALYLLKSLKDDLPKEKRSVQMLPCCGFFMIPNADFSEVEIMGCPNGIDWSTFHMGNKIKLVFESGEEEYIELEEYKSEVVRFAEKIKEFYDACTPKILPKGEYEMKGYLAFLGEFDRLYNENKQ